MKKQQAPVQAQLRKYLYQKAAHNKVPLSGTFELTPRCNMNCRMCYIRMSEAEMRAREESIQQKNGLRWEKPVQRGNALLAADWRGTIS